MEHVLKMGSIQLFFGIVILMATSCKNDDNGDTDNPVNLLPPATEIGAGTLGCLINGEPFIPETFGRSAPSGFYQFCCDGFFTLGIDAAKNDSPLIAVAIDAIDILPIEETEYMLTEEREGNFVGRFTLGGG